MHLSPYQLEALPYLDWLLNPILGRGTGRSYIIGVALIRAACKAPGTGIYYLDHHNMHYNEMEMGYLIHRLVTNDPRLAPYLKVFNYCFQLDLPEPIENWLPEGSFEILSIPNSESKEVHVDLMDLILSDD